MYGERYFTIRKRLAQVVLGVRGLGNDIEVDVESVDERNQVLEGLRNPFLFVVCGEVNAGKSSFINGLFGQSLCQANVLPETDRVEWYRYAEEPKDVLVTDVLEERWMPFEFLRDFNVVDTPGTNSIISGHQDITERFLPTADLILFVFPVNNPWGAVVWDFIEKLPPDLAKKVVLILQQKDLRGERDVKLISQHIQEVAKKKLGHVPEIFCVSANLAMEAWAEEDLDEERWKTSGYRRLGDFISETVTNSESNRRVLHEVREAILKTLRGIEDQIEFRTLAFARHDYFLKRIDEEIDDIRKIHVNSFVENYSFLRPLLKEQIEQAKERFAKQLGFFSSIASFFNKERDFQPIEQNFADQVEEVVRERSLDDAQQMLNKCYQHWEQTCPAIQEELQMAPPDFQQGLGDLSELKARFADRFGKAAHQAVKKLKLKWFLDAQFEARKRGLRQTFIVTLLFLILAGIAGIVGQHLVGLFVAAVGLILLGVGIFRGKKVVQKMKAEFARKFEFAQNPFSKSLQGDYRNEVDQIFTKYMMIFEEIQTHISQAKRDLQPQLKRWNDLYVEMMSIGQEIDNRENRS